MGYFCGILSATSLAVLIAIFALAPLNHPEDATHAAVYGFAIVGWAIILITSVVSAAAFYDAEEQ